MKVNKFYSILFDILVKTDKYKNNSTLINKIWDKTWNFSTNKYKGAIQTKIHGFEVFVNNGYMYSLFSKRFIYYNNPLVQLVYSNFKILNRKINIIDIGAAIGDTTLLVLKNCPGMIENIYCIDKHLKNRCIAVPTSSGMKGLKRL